MFAAKAQVDSIQRYASFLACPVERILRSFHKSVVDLTMRDACPERIIREPLKGDSCIDRACHDRGNGDFAMTVSI